MPLARAAARPLCSRMPTFPALARYLILRLPGEAHAAPALRRRRMTSWRLSPRRAGAGLAAAPVVALISASAWAQTAASDAAAAPTIDSGDTAWLLTATALVLMMTIPGVALFYG